MINMKLFLYEILKLIKRKQFWNCFFIIILVNFTLVYTNKITNTKNQVFEIREEKVLNEIQNLTYEDALLYMNEEIQVCERMQAYQTYLELPTLMEYPNFDKSDKERYEQYKDDIYYWDHRRIILQEYMDYYQKIISYPSYIQNVLNKANTMMHSPMWNMMTSNKQNEYIANISLYEKRINEEIVPIRYRGIEAYVQSVFSKILSIVFIGVITHLLLKEEEENIQELIDSCKNGKKEFYIAKISCFIVISFLFICLFQWMDLLIHQSLYVGWEWNAPIQSIPSLYSSHLSFTIFEWNILSVFVFSFAISLFGCFIFTLYHVCKEKIVALFIFIFFLFIEAILYIWIPTSSYFVFLKYFNIFQLFAGTWIGVIDSYYSILSIPISNTVMIFLFCISIGILSIIFYIYKHSYKIVTGKISFYSIQFQSTSLYVQESSRILQTNKGIFLLIIAVLLPFLMLVYEYKDRSYEHIHNLEKQTYAIYQKYEGETDQYKDILEAKMDTYVMEEHTYQNGKQAYKNNEITYEEFMDIERRYEERLSDRKIYLKLYSFVEKQIPHITYTKGFSKAFSLMNENQDLFLCIAEMIVFLLLGSCIAYKEGEEDLYFLTYKGKNIRKKTSLLILFILFLFVFIFMEGINLLFIHHIFPFGDAHLSLETLFLIENKVMPIYLRDFSVLLYWIVMYLIRLFGYISVLIISIVIFRLVKNRFIGILCGMFVFLFPIFLYYNGFSDVNVISIFDICMGNMFLLNTYNILKILSFICLDCICIWIIHNSYKRKRNSLV